MQWGESRQGLEGSVFRLTINFDSSSRVPMISWKQIKIKLTIYDLFQIISNGSILDLVLWWHFTFQMLYLFGNFLFTTTTIMRCILKIKKFQFIWLKINFLRNYWKFLFNLVNCWLYLAKGSFVLICSKNLDTNWKSCLVNY